MKKHVQNWFKNYGIPYITLPQWDMINTQQQINGSFHETVLLNNSQLINPEKRKTTTVRKHNIVSTSSL